MQQSQMGNMVFGYVSHTDSLEYFDERVKKFQNEGKIPDLEKEADYTIYRWKSGFLGHESIVLGCQEKFFTIELRVMNSKLVLYTTAENINEDKLKKCGNAVATGLKLIDTGRKVLKNMNGYNFVCNNCQDFVNNFLKEIEMIDQIEETDFQSVVRTTGTAVAIAGLAYLGFSWLTGNNKRKQ